MKRKGEKTRWRVFVIFTILLNMGLRRGELLILPVDTVKSSFDNRDQRTRYWLNVTENPYELDDVRYNKPSIKTAHSYRQIPVSESTAILVQSYIENCRGRPEHSFLINSQFNLPMSHEALTKLFSKISKHLSKATLKELEDRTGKTNITPHDLRHTCAVVFLNQLLTMGDSMDEALVKMRCFFGWSPSSDMPVRYARAVFEDRLANVWSKIFADQVEILRAIPRGL
ncbi:site-specific integrase [Geobacter sp. SVR]|uniref:site-specific integrase n=1 Tax=Geobacter sp. SVR TaxID=2495594 RepID=UPI00195142FD|nr:site-specific integrase [Geobacter sp. SVR]